MGMRNREKRKCERKNFISKISVLITPEEPAGDGHPPVHALAMDICDNGISFYIDSPVKKKQNINVQRASRKDICKNAVVRWVRKFDKGLYKAGLMFVD